MVADKGYHSNAATVEMMELGLRTNRRTGSRASPLGGQERRAGRGICQSPAHPWRAGQTVTIAARREVERNFAHQFDTGGMDRLYLRGWTNVHNRLLIQAAACNLRRR